MLPSPLLLFFLLLRLAPSPLLSSPLPTVAIAHTAANYTFVCALTIDDRDPDPDHQELNCVEISSGRVHSYPTRHAYYAGITAGDDFLCGVATYPSANFSAMLWWDFTEYSETRRVYKGDVIEDMGAGNKQVCGLIRRTGRIHCWRWPSLSRHPPGDVKYVDLAVGKDFLCGLLPNGKIRCFGDEKTVVGNEPDGSYTIISAGVYHACAIKRDIQTLHCWGSGSPEVSSINSQLQFHAVALGRNRTCAIQSNYTVACWGPAGFKLPLCLEDVEFLSIQAKGEVFCGVRTKDYKLLCWGSQELDANPIVFNKVLPGPCKPSCPCNRPLPDSARYCPSGASICAFCDIKVLIPPPPSPHPPAPRNHTQTTVPTPKNRRLLIYIIVGAAGTGIFFLALTAIFLARASRRVRIRIHNEARPAAPASIAGSRGVIEEFPLELLHAITDGFSDTYRIGSGSFGSVYRATLADGSRVAIKRAEPYTRAREQAFLSELSLLSRVNHRNLVRLLGYCAREPELVLVYEYMSHGTLHDHLHTLPSSPLSSWASRLGVALDAARGLEYLHRYAVPPVIHRDIKPSNILLDDTWTAKVADFGLGLVQNHRVNIAGFPTAGTVGYMDPEYYRSERLTTKSDVYSFGVVLLELITGRKAIHRRGSCNGEPSNVVEFAVPKITADEVWEVLDPALPPPRPCEVEAVQQVGYLAADCVCYEGRMRPDMAEVVDELERAVAACSESAMPVLLRSLTSHSV